MRKSQSLMPEKFYLSYMFRSIFYHCLCPPPQIMAFSKRRYLTFRNLSHRAILYSNHSCMANSCCLVQDGVVYLVKSASILQSFLINKYISNTSSGVNECHVPCLLSQNIVPLGILVYYNTSPVCCCGF